MNDPNSTYEGWHFRWRIHLRDVALVLLFAAWIFLLGCALGVFLSLHDDFESLERDMDCLAQEC